MAAKKYVLARALCESGVPRVQINWKKVQELQRTLSKIQKRRVSFSQIMGSRAIAFSVRARTRKNSALSIKNFRRIYHYFRDHELLHDYAELLISYEAVRDVHDEQSAVHAVWSNQVPD